MPITFAASLIETDEHGRAWISGANTKVIEVALDKIAHGWSPDSNSQFGRKP
jgi:hypothetical protein